MNNLRIKLLCECCGKVWELPRTEEIPQDAAALKCNFCLDCEDRMTDNYNEWYINADELPVEENQNQLKIDF